MQTAHPLPENDGTATQCAIGNRPKLIQFVSDEVPVDIWVGASHCLPIVYYTQWCETR